MMWLEETRSLQKYCGVPGVRGSSPCHLFSLPSAGHGSVRLGDSSLFARRVLAAGPACDRLGARPWSYQAGKTQTPRGIGSVEAQK